jgi:large subunit ribosomal protein L29
MEYKELKKKTEQELHKLLAESRDKLRELRFKDANKQLKDVRSIRKLRVTIAEALTVINDRRLSNKQPVATDLDNKEKNNK